MSVVEDEGRDGVECAMRICVCMVDVVILLCARRRKRERKCY